jgi:hypothetical protein
VTSPVELAVGSLRLPAHGELLYRDALERTRLGSLRGSNEGAPRLRLG